MPSYRAFMLGLSCTTIFFLGFAPALFCQCECYPSGSPPYGGEGYTWVWDYTSCSWVEEPSNSSPIIIDTDGSGFHLTSAADGVKFDFFGTGTPIQMAWTEKGSTNGWLTLPVNGQITSARDMFGSITAQPLTNSHPLNGFAALAIYDLPGYGGNHDGVITPADAVWKKLRVWIDTNHDGVAQPEELHTLEEIGIAAIPLEYVPSQRRDGYGNTFRFRGGLVPVTHDRIDRKIFDVFLVTK